ncbi:MAG: 3-hydroxyacyl-CoA dehydrogenase NAD-binding domain-containing protein [Alphaproteobacteria bacterium]|nr:3-hydroxyacyl-CoA dehydrogenase NAD-binding domain-containing protein [Alphaproteobacteria bacterium]
MTETVEAAVGIEVKDGIAVITVDNPPVNAISQAIRQGLIDAMKEIAGNEDIKAAIIIGAGRVFIAGADVREFGKPPLPPTLPEAITAIETCDKPVVAAIHGVALGGGLEIALGCHYRIADGGAKLGLPEVNLGLIPGAGGTQRLPRVIGIEKALDLISTGRQAGAREAAEIGLVDAVADGDLEAAALDFARARVGQELPIVSARETPAAPSKDFFEAAKPAIAKRARGQNSPLRALEAVEIAATLPFAEGVKREREIFVELRGSDQALALRHAFFAERAVAKVPGLEDAKAREVAAIAVIGGGTMGAGIAVACLRAGFPVIMAEANDEALERGLANVTANLDGYVSRGRMTEDAKAELLLRLTTTVDYGELADADLVIEAVFEDLSVKKEVFGKLDAVMKPGAVIATNTSYLDINEIAAATSRPGDVIGLHFFSPAHIMRLLEIVRADKTAPDVIATGFAVGRKLGKVGVLSGVCDGFIGNRILAKFRKQADYMVEDGALPWEVDAAMEAFGMAMGPFKVMDLSGLDISWAMRKRQAPDRDPKERYVGIADRICEAGWLGRKTGRGWYIYEKGAQPAPNPDVEKIIIEESASKGIKRRTFTVEDIQNRILHAMINEGAKIVDEGIAKRPLDVDMVEVMGYGFPRWRGGPMCAADIIGLDKVLSAIKEYAEEDDFYWAPSPLLERLAAEGKSFSDLNGA